MDQATQQNAVMVEPRLETRNSTGEVQALLAQANGLMRALGG